MNEMISSNENAFHGIVTNKSNGMKTKQLAIGIYHNMMSHGMPHGSHQQNKLSGNIVNMYSTFGVT